MSTLKISFGEELTREQMKNVTGGSDCRLAIRNEDGSFRGWTYRDYSVQEAQNAFLHELMYDDGSYVSGYCCSSCPY